MTEIIQEIQTKFGAEIQEIIMKSDKRVSMVINKDDLINVATYLYQALKMRFIIASAFDSKETYQIMYHFSHDMTGLVLNLNVHLPKDKTEVESLTGIFEASNWIEREMNEIMGITFLNHPNPVKLLSEGNWPEGKYPYRKGLNK